jgi:hypothetical protein
LPIPFRNIGLAPFSSIESGVQTVLTMDTFILSQQSGMKMHFANLDLHKTKKLHFLLWMLQQPLGEDFSFTYRGKVPASSGRTRRRGNAKPPKLFAGT